jgi:putative tryptophan/tyrosine transport system substrate-binding protein
MRRRNFIALLGSAAAAWPLAARAQQAPLPVIGFVHLTSRDETRGYLPDFQQGLADAGFIDARTSQSSTDGGKATTIGCQA